MRTQKLSYRAVASLGFLVYFFSYAMRLDYSASLVAIVSDLGITNTMASAAVTGSFITYGVGQIVCGFIGDRISPVRMITAAMLGTVLVNTAVSFCSNIAVITVLWSINGICQAMLWPPLTRFFSEQLDSVRFSDAITVVALASSVGTMFVYVFVPFVLEFTVWRNVFRYMAAIGTLIILVWCFSTHRVYSPSGVHSSVKTKDSIQQKISVWKLICVSGLIPVFFVIIIHGALRDGIQTWLPTIANEKYGFAESSSVLSTAVLPALSIVCVIFANALYHRLRNELKTIFIMFGAALAATVPMGLGFDIPALAAIVLASLVAGCMHGVNMLMSVIPENFSKFGMVSTFTGLLNAFTYVGASVSSYGFAAVSESIGWGAVLVSWLAAAAIGFFISFFRIKGWTVFLKKIGNDNLAVLTETVRVPKQQDTLPESGNRHTVK